jgi:hypothetical protein
MLCDRLHSVQSCGILIVPALDGRESLRWIRLGWPIA